MNSGKFNITVFKRIGSDSVIPHPVKVVEVDYESQEALIAALKGQDAVIFNLGLAASQVQPKMIDAAVAAGVKRFIPGEFGSAMDLEKTRQLPVFGFKVAVQKQLEALAQEGKITYTYVWNGLFLDWGLKTSFVLDMAEYKPKIYDGGDHLMSTTTVVTVGKAVVGILTHPEETKNRPVWIQDTAISQNKLLAIAKKFTPGKTWEPIPISTDELKAKSDAKVAKGIYDMETIYPYLFVANFSGEYGAHFQKLDNELLGIKEMTDEEIEAIVKTYVPKN